MRKTPRPDFKRLRGRVIPVNGFIHTGWPREGAFVNIANGVMMQFFQWYDPFGGVLWDLLKDNAQKLAAAGFTSIWIPPAYKGSGGGNDAGYGCYDLFDLGEFDQKNSVRTKY